MPHYHGVRWMSEVTRLLDEMQAIEAAQHANLIRLLDEQKRRQRCIYCSIAAILIITSVVELFIYAVK